jgi:hypothetical protein
LAVTASALAGVAKAYPTATPAASCTPKAFAYAGLFSNVPGQGIETVVTTMAAAQVPSGHVAGWIGVGGPDAGPGGQAEWLQTGVNTRAGGGTELYAEITQPGVLTKYVRLAAEVAPGSSYHLAVAQVPGKPNVWHVLLNGKPATGRIYLPGSSRFAPMAMSESWNGGTPSCNGFNYRFDHLRIRTNGSWRALTNASVLSDSGYKVIDRTNAGFTAVSA